VGRRRRSLLGRTGSLPTAPRPETAGKSSDADSSAPDEAPDASSDAEERPEGAEAAATEAAPESEPQAPAEPEPAPQADVASDTAAGPAPDVAPEPEPESAPAPEVPAAGSDVAVEEVVEPSYVETGSMGTDTTDDGWGGSVWDRQDEAPSPPAAEGAAEPVSDDVSSGGADAPSDPVPEPSAPPESAATEAVPPEPAPVAEPDPSPEPQPEPQTIAPAAEHVSPEPTAPGQPTGAADAPIGNRGNAYGDLDMAPPPTEEVPSGVMEDVGVSYNAPMNVPEPPPIPGILDRFTPPPADRQYSQPNAPNAAPPGEAPGGDAGFDPMNPMGGYSQPQAPGAQDAGRPSYLPDTPAGAERQEMSPKPASKPRRSYDDDLDDDDESRPPVLPVLMFGGLVVVAVVGLGALVMGLWMLVGPGSGGTLQPVDGQEREEVGPDGVELRNDMRQKPGLIGEDEPDEPDGIQEDPNKGEEQLPEDDDEPEDDPPEAAAPAPRPSPRPAPQPAPVAPAPAPAAASTGVIKVRSNRRVLVFLDNSAVGYSPQDIDADPGWHTVSAMIAGQPASKRTEDVKVSAGSSASVDFAF